MARRTISLAVGMLVGLMLVLSAHAAAGSGGGVAPRVSHSLSIEFYDFFNVPYPEYWGYRQALYGDLPIGAECFSQEIIDAGRCTASDPAVPDASSFPYTNWYPGIGNPAPTNPNADPWILAPYRIRARGTDVPGYTLAAPVYFPTADPSAPAGQRLDFVWDMHYITTAEANAVAGAPSFCNVGSLDGYQLRSQITLTMDLAQSKRMFSVDTTSVAAARAWWTSTQNSDPDCGVNGRAESRVENYFIGLGGTSFTVGTYDIYNAFEWFYQPFYTQVSGSVAADGTTTVTIDHLAWGTEVLMGRLSYWGSALYRDNYLDSTRAAGWLGMEISWFEDVLFTGSYGATNHDFGFDGVMNYHFQQLALPGPNGLFDRTDDVPYWSWGPMLVDYVNDFSPKHLISELDRLGAGATIIQTTTGHPKYGQALAYDFTPIAWNPEVGETWTFRFPTGDVVFYDPNPTPLQAHPKNGFVEIRAPVTQHSVKPNGFGTWDDVAKTWTVVGPLNTGGPSGAPGDYAVDVWPELRLGARMGARASAPWEQLYAGQSMEISALATIGDAPFQGASVVATASPSGLVSLTPGSGVTDAAGTFKATAEALAAGDVTITMSLSANAFLPGTVTVPIHIIPSALPMTMSLVSDTTEMMSFETATIRVRLESGGVGVEAGLLTPSTRFGGPFGAVTQLGGGSYAFGWTAPARSTQGFARIDVRAKVGGYLDATGFVTILVDPNKTNLIDPTQLFLLTSSAASVRAGGSVQATVFAFTIEGFVVSGGTVTASLRGVGTLTVVRDELNGVYRFTYVAPASVASPTNVLITISAEKLGYAIATTRIGITVLP